MPGFFLQESGPISFSEIRDHYIGTGAVSLSAYRRGGVNIYDEEYTQNVPSAGQVSISDYLGTGPVTLDLSGNVFGSSPSQTNFTATATFTLFRRSYSGVASRFGGNTEVNGIWATSSQWDESTIFARVQEMQFLVSQTGGPDTPSNFGSLDVWFDISTTQNLSFQLSTNSGIQRTALLTTFIRTDSSSSAVGVGTFTISCAANL